MTAPLTLQQQEDAYLARLGERVRAWRTEHGMSRKRLAVASGVSERYLAQLEAGQGNISVLLLRKVARAMGVAVERLVREDDTVEKPIALIGLRGAGKSTLGAKLAASVSLPFVELDREVEKEAGAPLAEVFAMYGQDAFRRFERRALERVLAEEPRAVIATGGSLGMLSLVAAAWWPTLLPGVPHALLLLTVLSLPEPEACRIASGEPNCVSSARLRAGPTPGRLSRIEAVIALSRRLR